MNLTNVQRETLLIVIQNEGKIPAIKLVRQWFGCGLKEAKDTVIDLAEELRMNARNIIDRIRANGCQTSCQDDRNLLAFLLADEKFRIILLSQESAPSAIVSLIARAITTGGYFDTDEVRMLVRTYDKANGIVDPVKLARLETLRAEIRALEDEIDS